MRKLLILAVLPFMACATARTAKAPPSQPETKVLPFPRAQVLDAAADYLTYRSGRDWDLVSKDLETGLVRSVHRSQADARSRVWVDVSSMPRGRSRVALRLIEERQDSAGSWLPMALPRSILERESQAFFSGLEGALKRMPKPDSEPPVRAASPSGIVPSGSLTNFANIGRSAR